MSEPDCGEVYEKYRKKVFGYAYSRLGNAMEAEDIVQTVFLKICNSISGYDEKKASLSTWIYTITRNTVYSYLSKTRVHTELALTDDLSVQGETAEEYVEKSEALSALADALETLPTEERDVIILIYYHGKTRNEAAEAMGITYAQARYLHDKALSRLSNQL